VTMSLFPKPTLLEDEC